MTAFKMTEEKKNDIEKKAADTLEKVGYQKTPVPVDVVTVANTLGFAVGNASLTEDVDGFIVVKEGEKNIFGINTDKLIGINGLRSFAWKRFIVAHELGHYVLHYDEMADHGIYAHRDHQKGKNTQENEADYFAANLLMPEETFVERYNALPKELERDQKAILLAAEFVVPKDAVIRRFEELSVE